MLSSDLQKYMYCIILWTVTEFNLIYYYNIYLGFGPLVIFLDFWGGTSYLCLIRRSYCTAYSHHINNKHKNHQTWLLHGLFSNRMRRSSEEKSWIKCRGAKPKSQSEFFFIPWFCFSVSLSVSLSRSPSHCCRGECKVTTATSERTKIRAREKSLRRNPRETQLCFQTEHF